MENRFSEKESNVLVGSRLNRWGQYLEYTILVKNLTHLTKNSRLTLLGNSYFRVYSKCNVSIFTSILNTSGLVLRNPVSRVLLYIVEKNLFYCNRFLFRLLDTHRKCGFYTYIIANCYPVRFNLGNHGGI